MPSPLRLALGGLLLAAPSLSHAQTAEPAQTTASRCYVGLAAYHSNFQNLASWRSGDSGFRVPVQLSGGYQLRPRLALELGVAYSVRTTRYAYDSYYFNTSGVAPAYYQYSNTTTGRTTSVTALARYGLTRQPAHRFQAQALGGLTWVHRSFYSRGFEGDNLSGTLQSVPFETRGTMNDLLLTAGVGLGYRLSPRFALNLDLTTNYDLRRSDTFDQYTGSAALGVRYRLGK
ncbi:outer membrane beta-barrel protein [Hymenobacter ruricola]|uniref:Outer membrane beta-barrel protein n=1 Tax=Hymenobacter ruricola TaxID=2791023 RepID=A0ABS0I295_9BACT|nr:outer membrane beta-barrel protein [Hymenobacter ruricola]MBF9221059.1 outer membrane beta-barrel protein [Hymenobacter ruricola]